VHGRHLVDGLVEDHEHILEALELLGKGVDRLEKGEVDPSTIRRLIVFLGRFADQCHHGKEELILFPLMEARGIDFWGGPLAVMACEHGMGRYFLRNALKALDRIEEGEASAVEDLRRYTEYYRSLLTEHIDKENNILFQMAREVIREGEALEEAEKIEEEMGHESVLAELDELRGVIARD